MTTKKPLKSLIQQHKLKRQEVADLLGVSITTIHSWLLPITSKAHRPMPKPMLELLRLKLDRNNPQAPG